MLNKAIKHVSMNLNINKKKITLTILSFFLFIPVSYSCTNFIVGKDASSDGSVMITYAADDYGMYGSLWHFSAGKHSADEMREVRCWDTNEYLGEIPDAPITYNVVGNINEHQVAIGETTFGGREELVNEKGLLDYGSLIFIALQRSRTAREAIEVMTSLVEKYGYCSEGESFSIADKNEAWILEMIGKGPDEKGAVWVAVRIPDDCISAHANQSRIHKFDPKDKENVMYSKDVIKFARKKGYFSGKDEDFDFANTYCPADFSGLRFCEARVWSFFNHWCDGMNNYLDYASGKDLKAEPMPLYIKPKRKLSVHDLMNCMRDHYEGTPFDITNDLGAGMYCSPYRPTPLTWEYNGKEYFNERPISTQQSAFVFVAQMRSDMPDAVGGILWFGNDDANMVPFTPMYCSITQVPQCFARETADAVTFSWNSAFWVSNWISNMVYLRYSMMFRDLEMVRNELDSMYLSQQKDIEDKAIELYRESSIKAVQYLTDYSNKVANEMHERWKNLGIHLVVKYNDQVIKPEENGAFARTKAGLGKTVYRPGFPDNYKKAIVEQTKDKYLVPKQ